jgi:hypothetical protein
MDFFNARYFTAALGRFNSPDPENAGADLLDPQTWNGYAYVRNDPMVLTDPSGLDPDGGGGEPIPVSCPDCTVTVNGSPDPVVTGDPGIIGPTGVPTYSVTKKEKTTAAHSPSRAANRRAGLWLAKPAARSGLFECEHGERSYCRRRRGSGCGTCGGTVCRNHCA